MGSVVELNEKEIEPRGLDRVCQVSVGDDALGRTRDIVLFLRVGSEVGPQNIDHGSVTAILGGGVVI